ncbi:flagellar hook-length control protein FliK [Vreelandella gomseomensis]|uniref:Flagellar hook-length control protein FliK n=1 Tax=Vreelandella gomseomensis TaxID=370766 RepID=A0ABU1GCS5_9GAMM|nr:flagellar hook-length control protein FliK [Halomonas gomseomensis]MDR5875283.1 flagellar hook-length control protein FliK [Halomonas gomseomensis]
MNIHQLLSMTQGQATSHQPGSTATADGVRGFFQQALSQASASPHQRLGDGQITSALTQTGNGSTSNGQASAATSLSALLESLGLDISPEALEALVARFAASEDGSAPEALMAQFSADHDGATPEALATLEASGNLENADLDEIAQRLALMGSYGSDVANSSTFSPSGNEAAPTASELAQQLGIEEGEAEQLVSLLSAFVATQNLDGSATSQGSESSRALGDIAQALGATAQNGDAAKGSRTESLASQIDARVSSRSSAETWVSALDTSGRATDTSAKANLVVPSTSSDTLLSALSSNNAGQSSGQALAAAGIGQPAPAATTGSAAMPTPAAVSTPVTSPAWPQQLGQQLVQFAQRGGDQLVQMQLHPAELGPLSISLKFGEQGAQAHFLSNHAQVRQVIEQAIPQLREALAEQGIALGDTSVGEQRQSSDEQGMAQSSSGTGGQPGLDSGEEGNGSAPTLNAPIALDGRVDLYA